MSIADLSDVDASGVTNGQVLVYNSSSGKFVAGDQTGSGGGNVTLTSFSVTTATPSGNGSLSYDNAGVFTFTPANVSSGGSYSDASVDSHLNQSNPTAGYVLSWNGSDYAWIAQTTDTDAQDLTLAGNVVSLSGQSGNVDLTSLLGSVAGNYADANVDAHLNTSSATSNQVLSWNGSDYAWVADGDAQNLTWNAANTTLQITNGTSANLSALQQTLSLSANIITISGSNSTVDVGKTRFYYANQSDFPNATTYHGAIAHSHADAAMYFAHGGAWVKIPVTSDITTANTNMKAYVDAEVNTLIGGANVNLDSLAEVANALANSNTELSTVAFTGNFSDVASRPTLALANSDLTYDGTTVDLSGVGATGPQGPQGNVGNTGATGNGVTAATISGGNLILTYSNTSTQDVGSVQGPQGNVGATGAAGNDGISTSTATVNGSGNLILTLSNASTIDAGNVRGADGAVDQTISINNTSNVITISGSGSTVDLTTVLQKMRDTDTDAQDLTLAGNVISLTGQSGNVDLTTVLQTASNTSFGIAGNTGTHTFDGPTETLTFLGTSGEMNVEVATNVISYKFANTSVTPGTYGNATTTPQFTVDAVGRITNVTNVAISGGGGSGDITSVVAGTGLSGGATSGDATLDLANTAVTPGVYGSASKSAQITVDQQGRITGVSNVNISGGGGGSGATVQRFKLNYNSSGQLDTTSDKTSLIDSISIDSASGGDVTVTFDSSITYPPASIMMYGYDYANNKYLVVPLETTMGLRELAGGGSSGSPTLFNGSSTIALKLRLREAETGASRSFGTTTHAWIEFVVYD